MFFIFVIVFIVMRIIETQLWELIHELKVQPITAV